jgi:folylpolyglutamate synthase
VEGEILQRDQDEGIGASEFEVLTATAFEIFNREKIDVGVVEVGMGGAEDATNILGQPAPEPGGVDGKVEIIRQSPLITVISKIGLDHQAFLGNTLEEIARQKAGILKPHVPVIFDPSNAPEVKEVIRYEAKQKGSPLYEDELFPSFIPKKYSKLEERYAWKSALSRVEKVFKKANQTHVPQHVQTNATLALMAVNVAFHRLGCFEPLTRLEAPSKNKLSRPLVDLDRRMLTAIPHAVFPGRQQRLSITPLTGRRTRILLDGAHNADSANALAERIERPRRKMKQEMKGHPITWVLAASDSKDATEIFRPIIRPQDSVVLVEFGPVDGMPWVKPMPVQKLEEALGALDASGQGLGLKVVQAGNDVLYALRQATTMAQTEDDEGPLVVAGSLYLVGDVLRLVRDAGKDGNVNSNELAER